MPAEVAVAVRQAFGSEFEVAAFEFPGDWAVARLRLDGNRSVVAKWLRSNPAGWRTDPVQLVTESVALQFAGELAPGLVPKVLAAEAGGVILLEDLSPRLPLDAILRRDGEASTAGARRAFARALGRLASSTASRDDEFRRRLSPLSPLKPEDFLGQPWAQLRAMLESFGVRIPDVADAEAGELRRIFADPGPFLALSNGDMATNNFMIDPAADDDGRLIDFEFAHFDHVLAHAANFFVPGPRWVVVNDPIADQLESEFRTALSRGIPEVGDDDRFGEGVAAGCVAVGLERCGNLVRIDGRPAGHASRAQRIATVEAAATAAEARRRWPALCDVLRDLERTLRHRWPDADVDFGSLPPYTPRLG